MLIMDLTVVCPAINEGAREVIRSRVDPSSKRAVILRNHPGTLRVKYQRGCRMSLWFALVRPRESLSHMPAAAGDQNEQQHVTLL